MIFKVLMATVVICFSASASHDQLHVAGGLLQAFGYVSGSGEVPWISFTARYRSLRLSSPWQDRDAQDLYWGDADQGHGSTDGDHPVFQGVAFDVIRSASIPRLPEMKMKNVPLLERASLMQLLLYEQTLSSSVPFMFGKLIP